MISYIYDYGQIDYELILIPKPMGVFRWYSDTQPMGVIHWYFDTKLMGVIHCYSDTHSMGVIYWYSDAQSQRYSMIIVIRMLRI